MSDVEYQDYDGTWLPYTKPWPTNSNDLVEYMELGTLHGCPIRTDLSYPEQVQKLNENFLKAWEEERADYVQAAE